MAGTTGGWRGGEEGVEGVEGREGLGVKQGVNGVQRESTAMCGC